MSHIFIKNIVGTGTYAIPESDAQLAAATAGFDALLSGIADLNYARVAAWVEDSGGPGGAEGVRTLNCLVQTFTYYTLECPPEQGLGGIDMLIGQIESVLQGDPSISTIDVQAYGLYETVGGGSSGDIRAPSIVVGNAPAGDTDDICDYLDTGDGAQLQAAIDAAALLTPPADVYARRGTYDLGAGVIAYIDVKAGVKLQGAGRDQTIIKTRDSGSVGNCGVYSGSDYVDISDLRVYCPTPLSDITGNWGYDAAVLMEGQHVRLERIDIEFEGGWETIGDSLWTVIDSAFCLFDDYQELRDCAVINCPKISIYWKALYDYGYYHIVDGFTSNGGAYGVYADTPYRGRYQHIMVTDWADTGVWVEDDEECNWSDITSLHDGINNAAECFWMYGSYYSNWNDIVYGTVPVPSVMGPAWGLRIQSMEGCNVNNATTECTDWATGVGYALDIGAWASSFSNIYTNNGRSFLQLSQSAVSGLRGYAASEINLWYSRETSFTGIISNGGLIDAYNTTRCSIMGCNPGNGDLDVSGDDNAISACVLNAGDINVSGDTNVVTGNRLVTGAINDTGAGNLVANNL